MFATEVEAKRAMTDIKYNYLQEGWDAEIYQRKKQTYTEPNIVRKRTDNNITEDPPRIEQNISNNKMTLRDEVRNSLAQDKSAMLAIPQSTKLKNAQRREI